MFKRSTISLAVAAAVMAPGLASAGFWEDFTDSIEVNGYVKNETAVFIKDGPRTGLRDSMLDDAESEAGDLMKFENSARFFINGLIGEESSWHADLNIICDSEGVNTDYQCHKSYTAHDWLKELYIDTTLADWSLRLGKQQVVWGTADGIKLLDIINPTDFRELNQNAFEDSRIPVWMVNAERDVGESGNVQLIVSQHQPNYIPGLNRDGDQGQPFVLKGVNAITGGVDGFLNITPALANVAASFNAGAALGLIEGQPSPLGLVPITGLSVDGWASTLKRVIVFPNGQQFIQLQNPDGSFNPIPPGGMVAPGSTAPGSIYLNDIAQNGLFPGDPNGNDNVTNLLDVTGPNFFQVNWDPSNPVSAFDHMPNATFATFNTFTNFDPTSPTGFTGATAKYVNDTPGSSEANGGLRYRGSTDGGLNFSVNYFYHYGANPMVNLSWHDAITGEELTVQRAPAGDFINNGTGAPGPDGIPDLPNFMQNIDVGDLPNTFGQQPDFSDMVTVLLHNDAGQYYGAFNPTGGFAPGSANPVELHVTEDWYRVHSIGSSFDYTLDAGTLPVVIRGEFLYDKDEMQPVIDKRVLGIGDLTNSLTMEEMDRFSYVLGVDVTVLTNLLVSGQFIQFRNLDYVDDKRTCYTQVGNPYDCSRYTGDFPNLSVTNSLQQAEKNKEFVSLFLSKPFGESQLGRWNNIIIWEEGGGYWNRLDAEYSVTDELIVSGELNFYWGDENTTFGQFETSSNAQIGVKYIWE
ncbi:MAG: RNA polymerase-associated protein rapA [bacterium]